MTQMIDFKSLLKRTKLSPVQKLSLGNRFKGREFPAESESDQVYEVTFGENKIFIRAAEGGLTQDEMDLIADILQRTRKKEQKAMIDMLTMIQIFPLAPDTVSVLLTEWEQTGATAKQISGPVAAETTEATETTTAAETTETMTP
jgi:hypothetical protein